MLSQTKEQVDLLLNKIRVLEFAIAAAQQVHTDLGDEANKLFKQASVHKLKLVEEVLRLSNASELAS